MRISSPAPRRVGGGCGASWSAAARSGADTAWTDRGGYVEGFDAVFDPSGFAVPAEQVQQLDPLARWLLHVSREALREAGVEGGPRVAAVFGNLSFPSAAFARFAERAWLGPALADAAGVGPVDARNRFMSGLPAHLVARALGLGPGVRAGRRLRLLALRDQARVRSAPRSAGRRGARGRGQRRGRSVHPRRLHRAAGAQPQRAQPAVPPRGRRPAPGRRGGRRRPQAPRGRAGRRRPDFRGDPGHRALQRRPRPRPAGAQRGGAGARDAGGLRGGGAAPGRHLAARVPRDRDGGRGRRRGAQRGARFRRGGGSSRSVRSSRTSVTP